jgi:hypothetical protein
VVIEGIWKEVVAHKQEFQGLLRVFQMAIVRATVEPALPGRMLGDLLWTVAGAPADRLRIFLRPTTAVDCFRIVAVVEGPGVHLSVTFLFPDQIEIERRAHQGDPTQSRYNSYNYRSLAEYFREFTGHFMKHELPACTRRLLEAPQSD